MRIAVLGEAFSYHHLAAWSKFGPAHSFLFAETFSDLIQAVKTGKAELALIAVENSIAGDVPGNYAIVVESRLPILGEIRMQIQLSLAVIPGTRMKDLTEVYSHKMGIIESGEFFKPYPKIKFIETQSTVQAARTVAERQQPYAGAISSSLAARHFGLTILYNDISNHPDNVTRFLVLGESDGFKLTTNGSRIASFHLHFRTHEIRPFSDTISHLIRITRQKQLSEQDFYIEGEWKREEAFSHLREIELDDLVLLNLGYFEEQPVSREPD